MPNPTIGLNPWGTELNARLDELAGGPATAAPGQLYGGGAPYLLSPSRTPTQNATGMQLLLTDAAAQGAVAVVPSYGPGSPIPMAPIAVTLAGDRYIHVRGAAPNATKIRQAANGAGAFTLPFNPAGTGNQDYWWNINGNGPDGSIILDEITLEGVHTQKPHPELGESSWLTYGIGFRCGRRVRLRNVVVGGFRRGLQFDGQLDHNDFTNVWSQGNWDNVYFGPKTAIKDSTFHACGFASASNSSLAIDPLGELAGSSFYGCHFGTAPYGVYFPTGTKPGTKLLMTVVGFYETIWEGVGNYRIFCQDGDARLTRILFDLAQFHGLEAGDNANPSGSQHMFHCATLVALGRATTGVITVDVNSSTAAPHGITPGQYITINGDDTSLPPAGPDFGGGATDATFLAPYRVLTVSAGTGTAGSDRITAQGTNVTLKTFDTSVTGKVARVGLFRAGVMSGIGGYSELNPDEIYNRDHTYGLAAETYVDCDDVDGWDLYDPNYLYNVQCRTSKHFGTRHNRMRSSRGEAFLCQVGGTIADADTPASVKFTGVDGDVILGTADRASVGIVGGTVNDVTPVTPAGARFVSGDYAWVQDRGLATVRGAGGGAGGQQGIAGATGQIAALANGVTPASGEFPVGKIIGPNLVKL